MATNLDCIVVGFNDHDLQAVMAAREKIADSSGAFRQLLGSLFRRDGKWLHHTQYLNALLGDVTGRTYRLHPMELANLAVAYLQSYLLRHGFDVEAVNFFNSGKDRLTELLQEGPRAVAITTTLYVEPDPIIEIVHHIRQNNPETVIIAGGPYILNLCSSSRPLAQDTILESIGADIYVHEAQGEATLARILRELRNGTKADLSAIPNLVYRPDIFSRAEHTHGRMHFLRTPRVAEENDIDACAVDWRLVPRDLYVPTAQIILSRSCPYHCSFCRYPTLAGPWKFASVDTAETQMRQLHEAGARYLFLYDDSPNIPLPRFKQLLNMMIRNKFEFSWFSNLRCTNTDDETYDLMKASGCWGVLLGIESGDETILRNMNKRVSVDAYRKGIAHLRRNRILTYGSFIVGFPGETEETVDRTRRFIEDTQLDYFQLHVYYHSKSVPIQLEAARFGLVGSDYSWRHATMDWRGACDAVDRMRRSIKGPVIGTSYLSTFWLFGYLLGKGVTMPHIRRFMELSLPVVLRNAGARRSADIREYPPSAELLQVVRDIAGDLDKQTPVQEESAVPACG